MNHLEPRPSEEFQLPDGRSIDCRSRTDFDILVREFLKDDIYAAPDFYLPEGSCVFDVGANVGFYVLRLNAMLESGSVFAFEPVPATFDLLRKNLDRYNHLDLNLFNCGLSDTSGKAAFKFFPKTAVASTMCFDKSPGWKSRGRKFVYEEIKNRGGLLGKLASITPPWLWFPVTDTVRWYYQRGYMVECELRTLSEIVDEHNVERIDLLKIDVEGAEESVLAGIRDEHWPIIGQAVIEVHYGLRIAEKIGQGLRDRGFNTTIKPAMEGVEHLQMIYAVRGS